MRKVLHPLNLYLFTGLLFSFPFASNAAVVIAKVYLSESFPGDPAEAVALYNSALTPAFVGRFQIKNNARDGKEGTIILPSSAVIPPRKLWWIAKNAEAFRREFGHLPDSEVSRSNPSILQASLKKRWPPLSSEQDIVSLTDTDGKNIDLAAYNNTTRPFEIGPLLEKDWQGETISMKQSLPYSWNSLILSRDLDAANTYVDTNTSADWDSGFSTARPGSEALYRLYAPGQSDLRPERFLLKQTDIVAAVAPESNYALLANAIDEAESEILIGIYNFDHPLLANKLITALRRGVRVQMLVEGNPVGKRSDQTHEIFSQLCENGAEVIEMISRRESGVSKRYRYMHAKYTLIDRSALIVGSENYSQTGHASCGTKGNRGWEVKITSPELAEWFLSLFQGDINHFSRADTVNICEPLLHSRSDLFSKLSVKDECGVDIPSEANPYTLALRSVDPLTVEPLVAPDFSLYEFGGLLRAIRKAKNTILVEQASVSTYWGRKGDNPRTTPNLLLAALFEAADRGVTVKVLLDSTFYNVEPDYKDPRDNDDTAAYINAEAAKKRIPISARLIDLSQTHFVKIHNKGLIIDDKIVFVGSLNWGENSAKRNREVGLLIENSAVAQFYRSIFEMDWQKSLRSLSRTDLFLSRLTLFD
ncbi:MAG: hypothetical protein HY391_01915 [Deltaproteobacteria bacterium]|nr:hypothetical protein [Deltaproteobacteria bacterium]